MSRGVRSRTFSLELYPDSESYSCDDVLEFIKNNYEYAFILHDKDIFDKDVYDDDKKLIHKKGERKKAHFHVVLSFKNARSIDLIKDEIGDIYINTCNFYAYIRYLIHLGYPNKFQYQSNDIITNMNLRVSNALKRDYNSQEQSSRILLDFIFSKTSESFLSFKQLTEFALENDCLIELKKNSYFYKSFCDEAGFRRY